MANFEQAYGITAKNEGGYVNDPDDNGGETYCGISRKFHPQWSGWPIVDQHKPLKNGSKIDSVDVSVREKQFYKAEFWDKIHGDDINNQSLAEQMYDFAVNAGIKAAIKMGQESAGLSVTGVMDTETIAGINKNTIA